MSVIYNTQFVDEQYSSIVEPNLYYDSILVPSVTFDDRYEESAGGIMIHKLGTSGFVAPTTPGTDFSDSVVADTLIQAVFNNNFKKSRKVYGVTAAAVAYNKVEAEMAEAIQECKQGWMLSGLACLAAESTNAGDTTALTVDNMETKYLGIRKALKIAKAKPDFVLASPATYMTLLQVAGDNFRPTTNEKIIGDGVVGKWYGMNVFEANGLVEDTVTYYNSAGSLITYDLSSIDFIMGDHMAFSVLDNFQVLRAIDSENFGGTKAQVEFNTAFKVTNSACIVTKYSSSPTA